MLDQTDDTVDAVAVRSAAAHECILINIIELLKELCLRVQYGVNFMTTPSQSYALVEQDFAVLSLSAHDDFVTNVETRSPSEEQLCKTCGSKLVQCQYHPAAPPYDVCLC